ncbi:MAG: hypothetical protein HYV96_10565 [Opitutae bacterium]|nr:hypothetical protein [Opitutae bacterium]
MKALLYQLKSSSSEPTALCAIELIEDHTAFVRFLSPEWLVERLGAAYLVKRVTQEDGPEEWWEISVPTSSEKAPPYTYKAEYVRKWRDVPKDAQSAPLSEEKSE